MMLKAVCQHCERVTIVPEELIDVEIQARAAALVKHQTMMRGSGIRHRGPTDIVIEGPEKHESWHKECVRCDDERHNECSTRCPREKCEGPCSCACGRPFARSEMYKLRKLLKAMGDDDDY